MSVDHSFRSTGTRAQSLYDAFAEATKAITVSDLLRFCQTLRQVSGREPAADLFSSVLVKRCEHSRIRSAERLRLPDTPVPGDFQRGGGLRQPLHRMFAGT